jgi:hypothetical protein
MQRLAQSIASLFIAPIEVRCSGLLQQNRQLNMRIAAILLLAVRCFFCYAVSS